MPFDKNVTYAIFVAGAVIVVLFIFIATYASRYVKVGPNEALIISGRRHTLRDASGKVQTVGFRILKGGGTFVWPIIEKVDALSLEVMTIEIQPPEVYTVAGVPIIVSGVAQVKVKGDDISIATAAEQFLNKSRTEMTSIIHQTLEGHLRAILGTMTVEEIYRNRDAFAQKVQEVASADLANMGMTIVSFTIKDIKDNEGYLEALGRPRIAQVKRDATIAEAEANRDSTIRSAIANQEGQTAKFAADTKIAEAQRDYQMRVQEYTAAVNQKKAQADLAYDLQKFQTSQEVKREEVAVDIVEKEQRIKVQELEIARKQRELEATVNKPAEAERYRIENLANAEKFRLETEATGQAAAIKATGFAQADVVKATGTAEAEANRARGLAQADVIKAQGTAEAEAMRKKAESWRMYNEAALAQIIVEALPKIAAAIAEPLAKTEKIIIINTGGATAGASKLTGDISTILAQLPPIIESLTGMKLEDLVKHLPKTGTSPPEPPPP
jgi:flotillin